MPERLSLATVATCAVLAGVVFGGAYALAHDGPAAPAPALASPATIQLEHAPIGELRRVSPLPALIVPPPRPKPAKPAEPAPAVEPPAPVVSTPAPGVSAPAAAPAPTPEPAPAPAPPPPAPPKKPLTFDDSG
jgi:hypothetical protein